MKKYAYIFPNSSIIRCDISHIETVKDFLNGLEQKDTNLYNKLIHIFRTYYSGVNYDDFAIFTLGWIKITSHQTPTICYAGYDFQKVIMEHYLTPFYRVDIVPNITNLPVVPNFDLDFLSLIEIGTKS